jgi:predicted amidohydrolase
MSRRLKVAAVQVAPITFDMAACVSKICDYVDEAAKKGAELIVFGEMCAGGYPGWRPPFLTYGDAEFDSSESKWTSKQLFRISEPVPGPSIDKLCHKAKSLGVFVVTGFAEADSKITGTIYNSAILIGPDGHLIGKHRKVHVGSLELAYWRKGDARDVQVFSTSLGKIGLAICYDVLFPEYTRLLDLMGEEIQCELWATSKGCEISSNCFPIARAMEGGVFVVSSCLTGKDEITGFEYAGESQIVDPFGHVLARAKPQQEDVILAEIDLARILDYRASGSFTLGIDRRDDLYNLSMRSTAP